MYIRKNWLKMISSLVLMHHTSGGEWAHGCKMLLIHSFGLLMVVYLLSPGPPAITTPVLPFCVAFSLFHLDAC